MPGAWCSNDDEKPNDTDGRSPNAGGNEQQIQSPSGRGNKASDAVQKKSDGAQRAPVVDSKEKMLGGKKEAVPSGLEIDVNPNTQSWSWGEPKKVDLSNSQPGDKADDGVLEVKASPGSETHVSKLPSGGEMAQSTGWDLPPNKDHGKPNFLDKIKSRLGSPSPLKNAMNLAEHDKNQSGVPVIQTKPGLGSLATSKSSPPILLSQSSQQLQASSSKQRPQQASVVGTEPPRLNAAAIYRKPYWSTRSKSSARPQSTTGDGHSDVYPGTEGSLYTIPEEVVQRKYMSHQVHQGRTVLYAHKTAKPKYMDSHESPYAVFVFNYRSEGK